MPHPSLLGIAPVTVQTKGSVRNATDSTRRIAWQPRPVPDVSASRKTRRADRTEPTDLKLDPSADHDQFGPPPGDSGTEEGDGVHTGSRSRSNAALQGDSSSSPRWRAVKAAPVSQEIGPN